MKSIIYFIILTFSVNSFAFFGIFEKKVDPMSLKTYEERMEYLLNHDPVFKKYWTERKNHISEVYEKNLQELKKIEDEIAGTGKHSDASLAQIQEENKKRQKIIFDQRMKEMESQLLSEWAIVDGEFVNLKDHSEKINKKRDEEEQLRRVQQFQSEEGLPVSIKMEEVRINVD